jgi:hypothetical protein
MILRTLTWTTTVFLHDDSADEVVTDDVINILREKMSVAIFDLQGSIL